MKKTYDIPYVPSTMSRVVTMVQLASVRPGDRVADLGCGDGRVLIEMVKAGATVAHGFEIDEERAALSKLNVSREHLDQFVTIFNQSFWGVDLSQYDTITLYGITSIMEKLEKKLKAELKPGAKVVSNVFTFPNWQPSLRDGQVYLYKR